MQFLQNTETKVKWILSVLKQESHFKNNQTGRQLRVRVKVSCKKHRRIPDTGYYYLTPFLLEIFIHIGWNAERVALLLCRISIRPFNFYAFPPLDNPLYTIAFLAKKKSSQICSFFPLHSALKNSTRASNEVFAHLLLISSIFCL